MNANKIRTWYVKKKQLTKIDGHIHAVDLGHFDSKKKKRQFKLNNEFFVCFFFIFKQLHLQ
jgi:hypothetical protein